MAAPVLGIDLGTTNSVVAVSDGREVRTLSIDDGPFLVPSVVSFHPNGSVLVGRPARERRLIDARNTVFSVKRLIGRPFESEEVRRATERFPFEVQASPTGGVLVQARGETYSLSEISAFVLREIRRIADASLGATCSRAVVTVPANFNELQRSATKTAGRVAGLEVLRILNEPTAAALAYGYGRGSRERVAVFDLGGGTFDVTILELAGDIFEVLATAGDTYLGGDDIDEVLADQMAKAFLKHHRYDARTDRQAYERLRAAAEWAKCQLSNESEVKLRVEELAFGEGGTPLDLAFALKRRNLESMIQPLVARCFDVCEDAMKVAGVRPTQLDNVILVGGSTRIPLVRQMVADYFGRQPLTDIDPDLVVAQGAAVQAHALTAPAERRPLAKVALRRVSAAQLNKERGGLVAAVEEPITRWKSSVPPPPSELDEEVTEVVPDSVVAPGERIEIPAAATGIDLPVPPPPPPPPSALGASTLRGHVVAVPPPVAVGNHTLRGHEVSAPVPPAAYSPPAPPSVGSPPVTPDAETASMHLPAGPPSASGPPAPPPPPGFSLPSAPPGLPPAVPGEPVVDSHGLPGLDDFEEVGSPPLLLDVTPHTLGVETVGGFCEPVIARNASIPVEQTKVFSTAQDQQDTVRVRICQGESRRLVDNQELGEVQLAGLRPASRGQVQIEVTFVLGADGTLDVRATDLATGQKQEIRVRLVGGVSDEEIQAMQARQQSLMQSSPPM